MGRKRTANAGVSIFAAEHNVEKKKRKASDVSIFDHVPQAQLAQQSIVQPPAGQQQQQRQTATTWSGPTASTWAAQTAAQPTTSAPPITSNVNPNNHQAALMAAAAAAAAGGSTHLAHQQQVDTSVPPQQLVGLPMRKTRSQQAREISAMMLMKTPHAHLLPAQPGAAMVHPNAAPLLPLPTQQAAMNMAAPSLRMPNQMLPPAPAPLPLQASVSDIASAFGLESDHLDTSAPLAGSPMRRTRSSTRVSVSSLPDLGRQGSLDSHPASQGSMAPLPMHPTQSMANSGLDALDALQDIDNTSSPLLESPGRFSTAGGALLSGSPMRRGRSRGLIAALPLQASISELVSSFIADPTSEAPAASTRASNPGSPRRPRA